MPLNEREFDIGDVLAVTTKRIVRSGQVNGERGPIDQVISFLMGNNWGRAADPKGNAAAEIIFQQHPQLRAVDVSGLTPETAEEWLEAQRAKLGRTIKLTAKTE